MFQKEVVERVVSVQGKKKGILSVFLTAFTILIIVFQ